MGHRQQDLVYVAKDPVTLFSVRVSKHRLGEPQRKIRSFTRSTITATT